MLLKTKTLANLLFTAAALASYTEARATTVKFTGQVSYQVLSGSSVNLAAAQISNQSTGGTSGTIRIELWAFAAPYVAGQSGAGYRLGVASLGQLQGGYSFNSVSQNVTYAGPANGTWYVSMLLTEYVGSGSDDGYQLDDYLNFTNTLQVGPITPPVVTTQPAAQTVVAGGTATFSVSASGSGLSYQWYRNATAISGATSASLTITNTQSSNAGSYTVTVSNGGGTVTSSAATLTVNAATGRLINLSVRTVAGTGSQSLIAGFVVGGTGTKPLLVRAIGPTLAAFGVTGVLPDPVLSLIQQQNDSIITSNAGWGGNAQITAEDLALGAFAPTDSSSLDSAIFTSLPSGNYSAQIGGNTGDTGIALAEIYDGTSSASLTSTTPRLINVSARSQVATGDGVLVAGMVIGGNSPETVLIRGIGPTLASFSVSGVLAAPLLGIYDGSSTLIASNVGWSNAPVPGTSASGASFQAATASVMSSVSAFPLPTGSADCAIVVTLPPGNYSAQVSGVNNTTGVALIEAYEIPGGLGPAPVISAQPTSQTINSGGGVSLSVAASGGPVTYQWYLNGSPISGATGSTYTIGSAQAANAGSYTVVVTNAYGSVTSSAATLTVNPPNSGGGGSLSSLTVYPGQGFYGSYDPYAKSSIVDGGTLIAYGGSPASGYTWTVSTGSSLPPGVALQPFGLVTYSGGTVIPGDYSFNVTVSDGSKTASGVVTFSVDTESTAPDSNGIPGTQASQGFSQITVDPFALVTGKVGAYYAESVFVNLAGAGDKIGTQTPLPLSWSIAAGSSLPLGLVLDSARGVVRGTPTTAGNYSFHIVVRDNAGNTAYGSPTYTLSISP